MGMAASSTHWTIARVRALPDDGRRYEVIDGELYASPAPTWEHQAAVQELLIQLRTHLAGTAIGRVVLSPADVEFRDDRIVEPDLFVVPLIDGRASRDWQEAGRLLLTVEVISPATARLDRVVKRALYQQEGVPEYWIVDVASRLIERWTPGDDGPEILADKLRWQPDAARASLELIPQAIFHAVATTWTNSQVHKKAALRSFEAPPPNGTVVKSRSCRTQRQQIYPGGWQATRWQREVPSSFSPTFVNGLVSSVESSAERNWADAPPNTTNKRHAPISLFIVDTSIEVSLTNDAAPIALLSLSIGSRTISTTGICTIGVARETLQAEDRIRRIGLRRPGRGQDQRGQKQENKALHGLTSLGS